ncbi:hypothetical protein OG455_06190 [Kitasatospora sp. NBC_01287]|nr:hypothetical protein [Kitasatospora sp. NBC_01287]MCX4745119.1 hypothetical protein [Kitasatospora sp. NBC_01287]
MAATPTAMAANRPQPQSRPHTAVQPDSGSTNEIDWPTPVPTS